MQTIKAIKALTNNTFKPEYCYFTSYGTTNHVKIAKLSIALMQDRMFE